MKRKGKVDWEKRQMQYKMNTSVAYWKFFFFYHVPVFGCHLTDIEEIDEEISPPVFYTT